MVDEGALEAELFDVGSRLARDMPSQRNPLKAVDDKYDKVSPYHSWKQSYSRSELESRLGSWVRGSLKGIKVVRTGDSPRVVKAKIVGSRGSTAVSGYDIQVRLGLRSTWFRLR